MVQNLVCTGVICNWMSLFFKKWAFTWDSHQMKYIDMFWHEGLGNRLFCHHANFCNLPEDFLLEPRLKYFWLPIRSVRVYHNWRYAPSYGQHCQAKLILWHHTLVSVTYLHGTRMHERNIFQQIPPVLLRMRK